MDRSTLLSYLQGRAILIYWHLHASQIVEHGFGLSSVPVRKVRGCDLLFRRLRDSPLRSIAVIASIQYRCCYQILSLPAVTARFSLSSPLPHSMYMVILSKSHRAVFSGGSRRTGERLQDEQFGVLRAGLENLHGLKTYVPPDDVCHRVLRCVPFVWCCLEV